MMYYVIDISCPHFIQIPKGSKETAAKFDCMKTYVKTCRTTSMSTCKGRLLFPASRAKPHC